MHYKKVSAIKLHFCTIILTQAKKEANSPLNIIMCDMIHDIWICNVRHTYTHKHAVNRAGVTEMDNDPESILPLIRFSSPTHHIFGAPPPPQCQRRA